MSKSEILYVKGMNLSESDDDEAEEDIWDDRKLNDAYDKALKIANAEVAKRVAMSTNNQSKKKEGQSSNKKEKSEKPNKGNSLKSVKKDPNTQWKTGTPCRAVYEGDGLEYEAFVLRIINDKECVVRFLGYENSEIVPINTLKPTQGTEERTRQIEQALDDKAEEVYASQSPNIEKMDLSDIVSNCASSHTDRSHHKKKKSAKKKKNSKLNGSFELPDMPFPMPEMPFPMPHVSALRNLGSMEMPLPPPPPLPMSTRCDSEDQAISTMLLSWYMSGYYTGLYQGLKRSKEGRKNI